MNTINRKIWREIGAMKSQTITIAVVVAAGVALFVASKSSYDSLSRARDHFYSSTGFAAGFTSLKKAPVRIAQRITATSGIALVETRITQEAALDFPGEKLPSAGRFMLPRFAASAQAGTAASRFRYNVAARRVP